MKKSMLTVISFILLLVLLSACSTAQNPVPTALPSPSVETIEPTSANASSPESQLTITDKYLLVFHACDSAAADCHNWENHRVYLAQSKDGTQWQIVPGWEPYAGSVPDVIRRGQTIYIYTPGQVVRYHLDTGVLDKPTPVTVDGAEGFVDPSLFVDNQGKLVLFFLFGRPGSDPAGCMPDQATCENRIGSATEVEGSDGLKFTLDEGERVKVTLSSAGPIRTASDPDIFFDGKQYIIYVAYGPSIAVWTSPELRGSYTQSAALPGGMLTNNSGGVASGYFDPLDQKYWTFAHVSEQEGSAIIHLAVQDNLEQQIGNDRWVEINPLSIGLSSTTNIESPGFAVNEP